MAIFVFPTQNCLDEAAKHGWQDRLESFTRDVEKKQTVGMFEHFPPPYIVKKKFGEYAGRLIAAHRSLGDDSEDSVVVLLSAMIRGTAAYVAFSDDAVKYGQQHFDELYSHEELVAYVQDRKHKDPPPPKPSVGEKEYGYLHDVLHRPHIEAEGDSTPEEDLVAESPDWVQRCSEPAFQNYHAFLHRAVIEAEDHTEPGGRLIPLQGRPGFSVLLRNFPRHRLLWLGAPVKDTEQSSLDELRKIYADVLDAPDPDLKAVFQASRRAYPAVLLADDNLWMNLQKETQANMALSPEESTVLRSARRVAGADATTGFPMFINGRAGSGKTTILQYLFTEFLFYHLTKGGAAAPPIYFTCNEELLRNSRTFVSKLLRCGADWWRYEGDREKLVNQNQAVLNAAFKEFHRHLLSLVTPKERAEHFPPDKYVGYAMFKQLWNARFGQSPQARKDFGPDISWHVIRSYIKGLSSDDLLAPEEYQHLDKKQITVTQRTYAAVYQNVWVNWFKPISDTEGHWDDQDLARYLIDADDRRRQEEQDNPDDPKMRGRFGLQPVHPVIFCDESQDFTRIELEVILRMSLFADRALGREEAPLVPFVFAGDEFQTLNPTGFRWDSIKAFFVEKFILALATHRPKTLELNFRDLTFNYRSSRTIVRFSNYVQALRARLFELTSIEPQRPWENQLNPPAVTCFNGDNDQLWLELKKASDVVIIVPCGEGEEMAFVQGDRILKSKVGFNEDGTLRMTVVSAIAAKGLEFPRVVVYGFGEAADPALLAPLRDETKRYADDTDRCLPMQYFINRLYVAVSRAKRRLFVVDSAEGFKKLWDFAQDEALEKAIFDGMKHGWEIWGDHIARLEPGRVEDISKDRASDPIEIAVSLAADGRARSYAPHLLQAANIYRNNGQEQEAARCKADALRIEGKFLDAAELFLSCGDLQRATDCFWRAEKRGWTALCQAAVQHPDLIQRLEYGFARALSEKPTVTEANALMQRLADALVDEGSRSETSTNTSWAAAGRALLDQVRGLEAPREDWLKLFELVEAVVNAGVRITALPRAQLAYRAGELDQAVKLWDQAGERGTSDYRVAKAFSAPYPEKLAALNELAAWGEIIAQHEKNPETQLSPDQQRFVGRAYSRVNRHEHAFPFLVHAQDFGAVAEVVAATQLHQPEVASKAATVLFAMAAATGDWAAVLPYLNGKSLPGIQKPDAALLAWIVGHKQSLDLALMRAMSRADSLSKLTWDAKGEKVTLRPFADYILKTFFPLSTAAPGVEYWIELGAAIERSGSRTGALRFYHALRENAEIPEAINRHAKERWVLCKEREAQFRAQEGRTPEAAVLMAESKREREKAGIPLTEKFPTFPKLSSMSTLPAYIAAVLSSTAELKPAQPEENPTPQAAVVPSSSAPSIQIIRAVVEPEPAPKPQEAPTEKPYPESAGAKNWTIGNLRFEFHRSTGRLNVHGEDGAGVSVRLAKGTCTSEDLTIESSDSQPKRFTVREWNLIVDLTDDKCFVIELPTEGFQIRREHDGIGPVPTQ